MKLYITPGSPYARVARIVVLEKQLEGRVEFVVAQTRSADSPYYRIAASGRVPYLVRDDGVGLEESSVICRYLDQPRRRTGVRCVDGRCGVGGAAPRRSGDQFDGWPVSLAARDQTPRD